MEAVKKPKRKRNPEVKYKRIENFINLSQFGPTSLGYIYVVRFGTEYKIGRTTIISGRLLELQSQKAAAYDEVHYFLADNAKKAELYLHRKFKAQVINRREWFTLTPEQYQILCNIGAYRKGQFLTHTELQAMAPRPAREESKR